MIKRDEFLSLCNITEEALSQSNIEWKDLEKIAQRYDEIEDTLRSIGKDFVNNFLYDIEKAGIHSYRYRTKDVGHLLEKVIRIKREKPEMYADLDHTNFNKFMTDLIGIRVFFLYREDWIHFHRYITKRFENEPEQYVVDRLRDFDEDPDHYYIAERPKAYKRTGDSKIYNDEEIDIITDGIYRSLHYIVKYKGYYVEIQGRTLFEEGWSEVDHDIVYKEAQDDEMIRDYSGLLNRLSGLADEMSSYFRRLKNEREEQK